MASPLIRYRTMSDGVSVVGEHTDEVLAELGYAAGDVAAPRAAGGV